MIQLDLPLAARTEALPVADAEAYLYEHLNRRLSGRLASLQLTDNRSTILTADFVDDASGSGRGIALRIHRSFAAAPAEVLAAVIAFSLRSTGRAARRQALRIIRAFFDRTTRSTSPESPRRGTVPLQSQGGVHDLAEIRDDLNRRYFGAGLSVDITWGRALPKASCRRRRRSVQLGGYWGEDRLIRVHRVLDRPEVPRFVVEAVVYHELLHVALPPEIRNGRRWVHTAEFRRRERDYPHLREAEQWLETHLFRLLRRAQRDNADGRTALKVEGRAPHGSTDRD